MKFSSMSSSSQRSLTRPILITSIIVLLLHNASGAYLKDYERPKSSDILTTQDSPSEPLLRDAAEHEESIVINEPAEDVEDEEQPMIQRVGAVQQQPRSLKLLKQLWFHKGSLFSPLSSTNPSSTGVAKDKLKYESLLDSEDNDPDDDKIMALHRPRLPHYDVQVAGSSTLQLYNNDRTVIKVTSSQQERDFYIQVGETALEPFVPQFKGEVPQCNADTWFDHHQYDSHVSSPFAGHTPRSPFSVLDSMPSSKASSDLSDSTTMQSHESYQKLDSSRMPSSPFERDQGPICIKLENLAYGYKRPSVLDIKFLERGVLRHGMKVYDSQAKLYKIYKSKEYHKSEPDAHQCTQRFIQDTLIPFLTLQSQYRKQNQPHDLIELRTLSDILREIHKIQRVLEENPNIVLKGSSLLIMYEGEPTSTDSARAPHRKWTVKLIDFEDAYIDTESHDYSKKSQRDIASRMYTLEPLRMISDTLEALIVDLYDF